MTPINVPVRLLKAFLVAVVLAVVFGILAERTRAEEAIILKPPSICDFLEPWGEAWFFFNCHTTDATVTAETYSITLDGDGTVTYESERTHKDGRKVRLQMVRKVKP